MCKIKKCMLFLLLFFFCDSLSVAETVVLLNNNNSTSSLSLHELNRIFTGKKKYWKNGEQIVIFLPEVGSSCLNVLSSQVFKKNNPSAIAKFYLKAVFQQKFTSPPTVSTTPVSDIIESPGGIALINRQQLSANSNVKIIEVNGL